jgi:hypothetical protein
MWLLLAAIKHSDFETALRLAAHADRFITRGQQGTEKEADVKAFQPSGLSPLSDASVADVRAEAPGQARGINGQHAEMSASGCKPGAFAREVERSHSSDATPIRRPRGRPRRTVDPLSRAHELALQEEYMRARSDPEVTMIDVIRFLRQRGDTVVHTPPEGYRVNGSLVLSAEELTARANQMRERLGKASFKVVLSRSNGAEG